jgi:RNA polymerase subunit RPABC4/transcription elongation factor Spt4
VAEPREERVKPCLQCEAVLPFDAETCSLCGASSRKSGAEEAVKPCLTCGELLPAADFFCPECGDFALSIPAESTHTAPLGQREQGALAVLSRTLAWTIAIAALVLLATVALDYAALKGA